MHEKEISIAATMDSEKLHTFQLYFLLVQIYEVTVYLLVVLTGLLLRRLNRFNVEGSRPGKLNLKYVVLKSLNGQFHDYVSHDEKCWN